MARVGASGYSAINARVRVMYSNLLTPQDYSRLYEAPDFNALIGLLSHTPYGAFLDQAREKALTPRRAAYQVRGHLAEAYYSIIHAAPDHAQPLLTHLYRHFEVNNLKAILRGIATHSAWDQVRYVLFPVGALSVLPSQEMIETGNLNSAVELLHGTLYYETVAHAMKRYSTEQNIFTLEVAIDLDYWRRLWKFVKELPSQDRIPAQKILGALVDMNNLMWAIRYRVFHNLTEEELINYTLPFGLRVKDDDIRAIAMGADYMQVAGKLFPQFAGLDLYSDEPENKLLELERHLQLHMVAQCRAAFVGNTFHIGTLLAYLLLCEMEIQDLTLLFEAKGQQLPVKTFQRFLVMNNPESSQ
jgi:V/A-type H+/Na+-transporting ATPase subunit C